MEAEAAEGSARFLHHARRRLTAKDAREDVGAPRPWRLARRRDGLQPRVHLLLRRTVCASLVQTDTDWCGPFWSNVTAKSDWPNQAVYMVKLLHALSKKCLRMKNYYSLCCTLLTPTY